jgi:hypothetical protein
MFDKMNVDIFQTNVYLAFVLIPATLTVVLVAGLVVIPTIDQAQASNAILISRTKVQQEELSSDGKRQNRRAGVGCSPWAHSADRFVTHYLQESQDWLYLKQKQEAKNYLKE